MLGSLIHCYVAEERKSRLGIAQLSFVNVTAIVNLTRMSKRQKPMAWWGPPKKFNPTVEDRKISWLELFYDLVYVIAISRITHRLGQGLSVAGFVEYTALFALIFWGWLNGSLYHDLHGNAGLRTRLMTLWQMMIIAALAVTIGNEAEFLGRGTTLVLMLMQLFITYQWWSVGLYDKEHRRYNAPYTILFLLALVLLGVGLMVSDMLRVYMIIVVLILNYLPPFIASRLLKRNALDLHLSASMSERLGLLAIIVFGEVVLGVVNGMGTQFTAETLLKFAFAIAIVFALWWLFFTLISNRNAKRGFVLATLLELLYIPTLVALGVIAAAFSQLLPSELLPSGIQVMPGVAVGVFVICIGLIMGMLEYPDTIVPIKKRVRISLFVTGGVFALIAASGLFTYTIYYLVFMLLLLLAEIYYLNMLYYGLNLDETTGSDA